MYFRIGNDRKLIESCGSAAPLLVPDVHDELTEMIQRSAQRKLETTLLSYSRQRLPRPARLYHSTSTKRATASSLATASPALQDLPAYLQPTSKSTSHNASESERSDMHSFLRKPLSYTIIPPPLPTDQSSAQNNYYFTDTPTQDLLAVMEACLHNLYDARRAHQIFDNLRLQRPGDPVLSARLYNAFIEAYLGMGSTKEPAKRGIWIEDLWMLIDVMEKGTEKVSPTASTYAHAILAWLR